MANGAVMTVHCDGIDIQELPVPNETTAPTTHDWVLVHLMGRVRGAVQLLRDAGDSAVVSDDEAWPSDETASQWYYLFKMGCTSCRSWEMARGSLSGQELDDCRGSLFHMSSRQLLIGIETNWIVMIALFLCAMGSGVIKRTSRP